MTISKVSQSVCAPLYLVRLSSRFSGLLPSRLAGSSLDHLRQASNGNLSGAGAFTSPPNRVASPLPDSPMPMDEEASLGLPASASAISQSHSMDSNNRSRSPVSIMSQGSDRGGLRSPLDHLRPRPTTLKRRPTAVRVVLPDGFDDKPTVSRPDAVARKGEERIGRPTERTPLIKAGVKPDLRKTLDDAETSASVLQHAEVGLGEMVELGLPSIMWVSFYLRRDVLTLSVESTRSVERSFGSDEWGASSRLVLQ